MSDAQLSMLDVIDATRQIKIAAIIGECVLAADLGALITALDASEALP